MSMSREVPGDSKLCTVERKGGAAGGTFKCQSSKFGCRSRRTANRTGSLSLSFRPPSTLLAPVFTDFVSHRSVSLGTFPL
jgi:hypothetical protein